MSSKRLVIIDGYSLLFRAFYGTRFLSTSDGRPTNALFGFVSMLFELFVRVKPDAMIVALDAPGKTFRHADYAEYKGTRRDTPVELISQLDFSRELIRDLNIPCIEAVGYEADDVVGTISRLAEENGYQTYIVTGDLDALQLVDDFVSVMTTQRGVSEVKIYEPKDVVERYGFGPELVPDYKSLVGDTSDNIKGVPGIGEKSATTLLQKFGAIENIIERMDEVDEKFRKKIEPNIELMKHSKWLATIVRDAPVSYDFAPYRLTQEHVEKARAALTNLEFRSHVKRFDALIHPYVEAGDGPAHVVQTRESINAVLLGGGASMPILSTWVGSKPYAIYLPVSMAQASMFEEPEPTMAYIAVESDVRAVPVETALNLFKTRPGNAVLHDAKNLYKVTDPRLAAPLMDTMIGGYVLQPGRGSYDLTDLMSGYLDVDAGDRPEQVAVGLLVLAKVMDAEARKTNQEKILRDIELPLIPVLAEMEGYGIKLDSNQLGEFSKTLQVEIHKIQQLIYEMAGEVFNIGSPKQVGEILFDKMQIPGVKKTKTGYATGAEILSELALQYPICGEILTFREISKLKSTYADSLPKMVMADGRIHTSFNQAVAATGRLSSNEPNLQNIPIRTELGRSIRKAFIAERGTKLGSFDYSQIELRILAHMCHDEALVQAFQDRVDVHTVTASLMFGAETESVTKEQRRLAKMLNYAVLYGVTDFGLAAQLGAGFSVSEAKALITQYNERFPKVKRFTEEIVEEARAKGFTATLSGRRRYFGDIHAGNRMTRLYAERQAVNAPIQGTAADMIKIAMLDVRKELGASATRMLLQVHDELVFEMPADATEQILPIRMKMEGALPLDVPVEVDAKAGLNWLEMAVDKG